MATSTFGDVGAPSVAEAALTMSGGGVIVASTPHWDSRFVSGLECFAIVAALIGANDRLKQPNADPIS